MKMNERARWMRWVGVTCLAAAVAACGGGGGGAGGGGGPTTVSVGGTVSNYTGNGLVLSNNGADRVTLATGATSFVFPTRVAAGAAYAVTVATQPNNQDCVVAQGSGNASADVTSVTVTCGPIAPLAVVSSDPADHATGVSRKPRVTLTTSVAVDPTTVRGAFMTGLGSDPAVDRSLNGTVITLTTQQKLLPLTRYASVLDANVVRGTRGERLAQAALRDFTTADGAWQPSKLADRGFGGDVDTPSIAMDDAGNALAVWSSKLAGAAKVGIYTSRYDAATATWSDAAPLALDPAGDATEPQVAMDAAGNAVAVWTQANSATPPYTVITASRYDAATRQWSAREFISHVDGSSNRSAKLVVHARTGAVTVTWTRSDALGQHVWTRRRGSITGGDWGGTIDCVGPDLVCDQDAPVVLNLRIAAANTDNRALITWEARPLLLHQAVWARTTANGVLGSPAQLVSQGDNEQLSRAVFDAAGTAYVVWKQITSGGAAIVSMRRLTPAGTWGDIELIASAAHGSAESPAIASNGSFEGAANDAVWLTWVQEFNFQSQVWAWKVGSGDPLTARRPVSAVSASFSLRSNEIVVDRAGNAVATWVQSDRFEARRYNALANVWSEPLPPGDDIYGGLSLGINKAGDTLAWWLQFGADPGNATRTALQTRRFE